jgi:hypothetical protein
MTYLGSNSSNMSHCHTNSNSNLRFAACLPFGKTSSFFTSYRAVLEWKPYQLIPAVLKKFPSRRDFFFQL